MTVTTMATKATLNVKLNFITLRIRFVDGIVVNITHGRSRFKVTSSSPALLADCKISGPQSAALKALDRIDTVVGSSQTETLRAKMERYQRFAQQSRTLIDFVEIAGLAN